MCCRIGECDAARIWIVEYDRVLYIYGIWTFAPLWRGEGGLSRAERVGGRAGFSGNWRPFNLQKPSYQT